MTEAQREHKLEYQRAYYKKHRDHAIEYAKRSSNKNWERTRESRAEYQRGYGTKNAARIRNLKHEYYLKHREHINEKSKQYRLKYHERSQSYQKKHYQANWAKHSFSNAQLHNKKSKRPFTLTLIRFTELCRGNCIYCGGIGRNGVDRIAPELGYVEGNVVSCCKICNTMKWTLSGDDFLKHIEKILEYQKSRLVEANDH